MSNARRKNAVHTSRCPANIEPLLRSGFPRGISVCTKRARPTPVSVAMAFCSARKVSMLPLPTTKDSTHLSLVQHTKPSRAMSSTSTGDDTCFLFREERSKLDAGGTDSAVCTMYSCYREGGLYGTEKSSLSTRGAGASHRCIASVTDMVGKEMCLRIPFGEQRE